SVSFASVAEEETRGIALELVGDAGQLDDEGTRIDEKLLRLSEAALREVMDRTAVLLDDRVEMRGELGEVPRRLVQLVDGARRAVGEPVARIERLVELRQHRFGRRRGALHLAHRR